MLTSATPSKDMSSGLDTASRSTLPPVVPMLKLSDTNDRPVFCGRFIVVSTSSSCPAVSLSCMWTSSKPVRKSTDPAELAPVMVMRSRHTTSYGMTCSTLPGLVAFSDTSLSYELAPPGTGEPPIVHCMLVMSVSTSRLMRNIVWAFCSFVGGSPNFTSSQSASDMDIR